MLEDVGSKMVFCWLSWTMSGHLGAKIGEPERKMRKLGEKKETYITDHTKLTIDKAKKMNDNMVSSHRLSVFV